MVWTVLLFYHQNFFTVVVLVVVVVVVEVVEVVEVVVVLVVDVYNENSFVGNGCECVLSKHNSL